MNSQEEPSPGSSSQLNEDEKLLVLYVWPGDWDLPSLDPECLTAMVFFWKLSLKKLNLKFHF